MKNEGEGGLIEKIDKIELLSKIIGRKPRMRMRIPGGLRSLGEVRKTPGEFWKLLSPGKVDKGL